MTRSSVIGDRAAFAARAAGPAAHLEDVRCVGGEPSSSATVLGHLRVVHDRIRSSRPSAEQSARARCPTTGWPATPRASTLSSRFRSRSRVGQLDGRRGSSRRRCAGAATGRAPLTRRTRSDESPGVAVVEAQAARVRVDVAELVGQQVQVRVLEDRTLPRSVACSIGRGDGSIQRIAVSRRRIARPVASVASSRCASRSRLVAS